MGWQRVAFRSRRGGQSMRKRSFWRVAGCDDVRVADAGLEAFRMTIEAVVTLTGRPGVYLGGEIEAGVVQVGDRLDLCLR
jgi:hypothetical protein